MHLDKCHTQLLYDYSISREKINENTHHDTSSSLQTQAERGDIKQQQVLNLLAALSAQDGRLQ